jgi:hypothetical protein
VKQNPRFEEQTLQKLALWILDWQIYMRLVPMISTRMRPTMLRM